MVRLRVKISFRDRAVERVRIRVGLEATEYD